MTKKSYAEQLDEFKKLPTVEDKLEHLLLRYFEMENTYKRGIWKIIITSTVQVIALITAILYSGGKL